MLLAEWKERIWSEYVHRQTRSAKDQRLNPVEAQLKLNLKFLGLALLLTTAGYLVARWLWTATHARAMGRLTACKSNLQQISQALEKYSRDHDRHYPERLDSLLPTYLKALPVCPEQQSSDDYRARLSPGSYTICCSGAAHAFLYIQPDYPRISNQAGLDAGPQVSELRKVFDMLTGQSPPPKPH